MLAAGARPTFDRTQSVRFAELQEVLLGGEVPEHEQWRRYYGRGLTPATIEAVLVAAQAGYLRDLTDLEYETLFVDPHLGSCVGKRVRALGSVKPQVVPATGDGVDTEKATRYADEVRQMLARIPHMRQNIVRLTWGHYHGRAALEREWAERQTSGGTRWQVAALHWIHPRRLSLGPERELRVRDDYWGGGGFEARGFDLRELPFKFISFTPQLFDDYPEREGYGPRTLYFSFFKRFGKREQLVLLEVFGKPWRIVTVKEGATVQDDTLKEAQKSVDKLGANATARLPRGVDLIFEQPGQGAGAVHKDVIQDSDDQISKLVLGNPRRTDAKAMGLGGDEASVYQDDEVLIFSADAWNVGELLTEHLSRDYVELNYGPDELVHAPAIEIPFEPKPDRTKEIDRTDKVLKLGIPLKLDQVYERIGFDKPTPEDATIQQMPGSTGPTGLPIPGGTQITDPSAAPTPTPAPAAPVPPAPAANEIAGGEEAIAAAVRLEHERYLAAVTALHTLGEHVLCARQPETVNGSPELLIDSGVREASRETARWGEQLVDAVRNLTSPGEIFEALTREVSELPIATFARAAERRLVHGLMLGALDSTWERENDEIIKPATFRALMKDLEAEPSFVSKPFDAAVRFFRGKSVLTKDRFEQLSAAGKQRAFTIARLARQELLVAAHAELAKQMAEAPSGSGGPSLKSFERFLGERLESAGWTPSNASHVETIFRTNVIGAYASGRHAEMTQPAVLKLRPYWQTMGVRDDRQRANHRGANGVVLSADHEFWKRAYPPFGYNCRCRVVSRSKDWVDRAGIAIGPAPSDLPDQGFASGTAALLG